MQYLQNTQEMVTKTSTGEAILNPYWEGLLDQHGRDVLAGYTIAIEQCDTMFDNLKDQLGECPVRNTAAQEAIQDCHEYAKSFFAGDREEVVVSLIEEMEDEVYQKNYENAYQEALKEHPGLKRAN